jgi:hypothetical protein
MLLRVFVLLTLLFAAATPSVAETRQIAKVSASQLKSTCDKAGGTFSDPIPGEYGCTKANCDGKGGSCYVHCNNQNGCVGITPSQLGGRQTLLNLLQNGDMLYRQVDRTPTDSLVTPGESSAAARAAPADPGLGSLY